MTNLFLNIGFVVLCILPLLGFTSQGDKINIGLWIALILCLRAIFKGILKLNNIPLLIMLALLPFSIWFGLGTDFKVILAVFIYILMYASLEREKALKSLNFVLICSGFVALYGIIQFLGFDSICAMNKTNPHAILTKSWQVTSFLGNPTYLGAFTAMLIPISIREGIKDKRFFILTAMFILATLMTQSDMAIGSMVISLCSIPFMLNKTNFIYGCILSVAIILILIFNWSSIKNKIHDNGRFTRWNTIVQSMNNEIKIKHLETGAEIEKKFNLFGLGAGQYQNIFPNKVFNENFNTCHNEYLQIYVEFGIITLICFILFLITTIYKGYDVFTKASLICICLNAIGLFVWQLGVTQFLSVYLLCLNKGKNE